MLTNIITDRKNLILNPFDHSVPLKRMEILGKEYLIPASETLQHLHIKITDECNLNCPFCIERDNNSPSGEFRQGLVQTLDELQRKGYLNTVSITGGEPFLSKDLEFTLQTLKKYPVNFLNINTNGTVETELDLSSVNALNISRHNTGYLEQFPIAKSLLNSGVKIRHQCVLQKCGVENLSDLFDFIKEFPADDYSFRQLMRIDDNYSQVTRENTSKNFVSIKPFLDFFRTHGEFVCQQIVDYYSYETWRFEGKEITLSFSDMMKTNESIITHEFILFPDGKLSNKWVRK